jgi:protein-tyrosine-phosphatase
VYLGNIYPSSTVEALFRKLAIDQNISSKWKIDSAVTCTSTHEIRTPLDYQGQTYMKTYGTLMSHISQQLTKKDLVTFDNTLCMDESNLRDSSRKIIKMKSAGH